VDAGAGGGPVTWLLGSGVLLLITAGLGTAVLLRLQRRQAVFQQRVGLLAARPSAEAADGPRLVRRAAERPVLVDHLAGLIGFDPARRIHDRLPWFVVLGAALLVARLVVLLAAALVGPWAWLALPPATVLGCRAFYAAADRRHRETLLAQFPDALNLIVRAVRVGIPVPEALRAVAREAPEPTRGEFDRLQYRITVGSTVEAALREMAARTGLSEYSFFAAALALQAQTGGGLTATLETLADIIRRRIAMKERGMALSAEARTSSLVLGGLPVFTGGVLYLVSPDYIGVLFTDPTGNMILGAAVLSLAAGMGAMRLIIRKSLS